MGGAGWKGWSCLDLFLYGYGYGYDIHVLRYPMSMHAMTFINEKKKVSTRSNGTFLQNPPITTTALLPEPNTLYSPSRSTSMSPNAGSFEGYLTSIALICICRTIRLRQHNRNSTLLLNDLPHPLDKRAPPLTKLPPSQSIQYPS